MGRVDSIFQKNLSLLMSLPWEAAERPRWGDGEKVRVKRLLHVVDQYDLRREFPILSLRPVPLEKCIREILWIYQSRSTDTKELGLKIWEPWADADGYIRGCYGDMVNRKVKMKGYLGVEDWYDPKTNLTVFPSQTDFLLWSIKNDPTSRRIVCSMFDAETNGLKPLQECAFQIQLSVQDSTLHMLLYQRSQDFLVANGWNVAQYAALLMMFAHDANLKPGILTHVIGDCHIYDRHEEAANEILRRPLFGPIPQITISERMEGLGFYDFKSDDFELWNYEPQANVKLDVAI